MNPESEFDQDPDSYTCFTEISLNTEHPYAVCDLTNAYLKNGAKSVTRRVELVNNRSGLMITDHIETRYNSEIWSFMHTTADIELLGNHAVLYQDGKKLFIKVLNGNFEFFEVQPVPLNGAVSHILEKDRSRYKRLGIKVNNALSFTISLLFSLEE